MAKKQRLQTELKEGKQLFGWLGLINIFLTLSPQLYSGFVWDDGLGASTAGAAALNQMSLFGFMIAITKALFVGLGRFFPLSAISRIPLFFLDRGLYKLSILILVVLNAYFFSELIGRISRSNLCKYLVLVLTPMVLQVRIGPDAIMGYHWVLQLLLLFTTLSLLEFWNFLDNGKRRCLYVSLALALASLLTYEISYVFFLIYFGVAWVHSTQPRSFSRAVYVSSPFFFITLGVVFLLFALRWHAGFPMSGNMPAYQPSFDVLAAGNTLVRHLVAALPTTYLSLAGLREQNLFEDVGARSLFSEVTLKNSALISWLFISSAFMSTRLLVASKSVKESVDLKPAMVIGLLFWILPGALISLSTKYQSHHWIDWGVGYLPGYISFFGVAALMSVWSFWIYHENKVPRLHGALLLFLGLGAGTVPVLNYLNLSQIVAVTNSRFRYPRDLAVKSVVSGLLKNLPDESYLVVDGSPGVFTAPAFFQMYQSTSFVKIASPGSFLGKPQTTDYSGPLYYGVSMNTVALPGNPIKSDTTGLQTYEFQAGDRMFYYRFTAFSKDLGYAVLGALKKYQATDQNVSAATTSSAFIFVQTPNAEPVLLQWKWATPGTLDAAYQNPVSTRDLVPISSGRDWSIFEIRDPTRTSDIDLYSLRMIVYETTDRM